MIAIYKDMGGQLRPDDYEPVAAFDDDDGWVFDHDDFETYYPEERTTEAILAQQIDGPHNTAVDITDEEGFLAEYGGTEKSVGKPHSSTLADFEVAEDEREVDDE